MSSVFPASLYSIKLQMVKWNFFLVQISPCILNHPSYNNATTRIWEGHFLKAAEALQYLFIINIMVIKPDLMAVHSSHYQFYWSLSEVTEEWDQNQALRTAFIYDSLSRIWPHKSLSLFGFGLQRDFCFSFINTHNFYFFLLRQARARGHHTKPGVISSRTMSFYWQDYKKMFSFFSLYMLS